MPVER
jgi:NAD(P)-dependent dehydrogenase (short-subunit alcohol dehydrogenase family)